MKILVRPLQGCDHMWAASWLSPSQGKLHGWFPLGRIILVCPLQGCDHICAASWLVPSQGKLHGWVPHGRIILVCPLQGCDHMWASFMADSLTGQATWLTPTWAGLIVSSFHILNLKLNLQLNSRPHKCPTLKFA